MILALFLYFYSIPTQVKDKVMYKDWEYKLSDRDLRKCVFHKIAHYQGLFLIKLKITAILIYSPDTKTV